MSDVLGTQIPLDPVSLGCFEKRQYVFNQNTLHRYDQIFTKSRCVGLAIMEITKPFTCNGNNLGIYDVDNVNGQRWGKGLAFSRTGGYNYLAGTTIEYIFGTFVYASGSSTGLLDKHMTIFVNIGDIANNTVGLDQNTDRYLGITAYEPNKITVFGEILLTLYMLG